MEASSLGISLSDTGETTDRGHVDVGTRTVVVDNQDVIGAFHHGVGNINQINGEGARVGQAGQVGGGHR